MARQYLRIALVTAALLLAADVRIAARQITGQADREVSRLREVLLQNAWAHDVRAGRVAIETRVLVFRETGEVSERVYDDTGVHDAMGSWQLEQSDGSVILILTGEALRDKGRFTLTQDPKDEALEFRWVGGERVIRFKRRKGLVVPGPGTPNTPLPRRPSLTIL